MLAANLIISHTNAEVIYNAYLRRRTYRATCTNTIYKYLDMNKDNFRLQSCAPQKSTRAKQLFCCISAASQAQREEAQGVQVTIKRTLACVDRLIMLIARTAGADSSSYQYPVSRPS